MTARVRVLCIDGGLADMGWIVATVHDDATVHLHGAGVVHTTPTKTGKVPGSAVQLGTSVSADSMRRAVEVAGVINRALRLHDPRHDDGEAPPLVVAIEAFTPPRGAAGAALKVGFGIGAALSAAVSHRPADADSMCIAQATAAEVKRLLRVPAGLDEGASKAAVRAAVHARFPVLADMLSGVPNGRREHAYDAAGVLLACIDRDRFVQVMPMRT